MDGRSRRPVDPLADGRTGNLDGMLSPGLWSWAMTVSAVESRGEAGGANGYAIL